MAKRFCRVHVAIWLGLLLRLVVAIWNSFYGPSFGAGQDAAGFHLGAVAYANGTDIFYFYLADIYKYILGIVYHWTTDSLFLGSWLSCVAWLASAGVLYKMMCMLSVDSGRQFKAMLIYGLLPSSILLTSVTLREAYELLAVNLAVYSALRICLDKSAMHWLLLVAAVFAMSLLHGGLLIVGLVILTMTALWAFSKKPEGVSLLKPIAISAVAAVIAYAGFSLFLSAIFNVESGVAAAVQARQDSWQQIARAHYSVGVTIKSDMDLLIFVPVALFQYWFQPMPWNIETIPDAGLLIENALRGGLLWMALSGIRRLSAQRKAPVLFILIALVVTEAMWAVGTINWGTAARHHLPSIGLLVLAAYACSRKSMSDVSKVS